jgi:hypothetical protein
LLDGLLDLRFIYFRLIQVLVSELGISCVFDIRLFKQTVETVEHCRQSEIRRPVISQYWHCYFPCEGVYVQVVDLVRECYRGRFLRVVIWDCDDEGECEMGVRGIGELFEMGSTCGL